MTANEVSYQNRVVADVVNGANALHSQNPAEVQAAIAKATADLDALKAGRQDTGHDVFKGFVATLGDFGVKGAREAVNTENRENARAIETQTDLLRQLVDHMGAIRGQGGTLHAQQGGRQPVSFQREH
jgi:hypothetical protein